MPYGNTSLQAALNGDREHPAVPRTPEELAVEARAAVDAGATYLHFHPYDVNGCQTLEAEPCAKAIHAVRDACPEVPISLSSSARIEPDPEARHELIAAWTEPPDLVTANLGEKGILDLCELLVERGIEIEAGLLSVDDAKAFAKSGIAPHCKRVLIEPLNSDPDAAVAHAESIEQTLDDNGIQLEQVHHGRGIASWAVIRRAIRRGHGIRAGLEDATVLPDGRSAKNNEEVVAAAATLLE